MLLSGQSHMLKAHHLIASHVEALEEEVGFQMLRSILVLMPEVRRHLMHMARMHHLLLGMSL